MKRKIFSVLFALVLICTMGLVFAPAQPAATQTIITGLELTVTPGITGAEAYYQVVFQVHDGLQPTTDTISVRFPVGTTVPEALETAPLDKINLSTSAVSKAAVKAMTGDLNPTVVTVTDETVVIWLPTAMTIPVGNWVMVEFGGGTPLVGNPDTSAGIINPGTVGTYTLCAWTCEEQTEVCETYGIDIPPGLADVYLKYQVPPSECGYYRYYYMDSFPTIGAALTYADDLWIAEAFDCYVECPTEGGFVGAKVVVHDGVYKETIEIDTPCVTVESMNGAPYTIIDAEGLAPQGYPSTCLWGAVFISTGCVTFDGFTVKNAGVGVTPGTGPDEVGDADENGNADVRGIYVFPSSEKCATARIFDASKADVYDCVEGRVNILNNIVYGSQAAGIQADGNCGPIAKGVVLLVDGNKVHGNQWEGFVGYGLSCGVECLDPPAITSGLTACSEITNNDFYGNGLVGSGWHDDQGRYTQVGATMMGDHIGGVGIHDTRTPLTIASQDPALYIQDNNIYENEPAGIWLSPDAAKGGTVAIKKNKVYDNEVFGISNRATAADSDGYVDVDCRYNDIYGNTDWGVKNWADNNTYEVRGGASYTENISFDAKENYWGELGGPSDGPAPGNGQPLHEIDQSSNALGNGDAVSHNVYYNPWLSVPYVDVIDEGIRYYGSDTLTLQQGWNTLSVPLVLHTSANTLTEISDDLGNFLIPITNWADAYQYDPSVPGWVTPTTLEPGRGYYIEMNAPSRFPVIYSNQLGLPAFVLDTPGWNLVGSAFGIDKTDSDGSADGEQGRFAVANPDKDGDLTTSDPDAEAVMDAGLALNSIGAQASVIVSPSVPGQLGAPWSAVYVSPMNEDMYTGEAYWAFLIGTATVAGFEITPFYFTPDMP